jgi:transcription elongation GreA/GreB family factor
MSNILYGRRLKKLREELDYKSVMRPKASADIAGGWDKGDLSENAEYEQKRSTRNADENAKA